MQQGWFDLASAIFALLSAVYWVKSARVEFPYGYDMDLELREAARKAGRLNAVAASLAAVAAVLPALKQLAVYLHLAT